MLSFFQTEARVRAKTGTNGSAELGGRILDEFLYQSDRFSPRGLTSAQAAERLELYGLNEIAYEKRAPWFSQLIRTFKNPFIVLLLGLSSISYITDDVRGAAVIAVMVLVSVLLTFFQEFRSSQAARRLREMVGTSATCLRDGFKQDIPMNRLVPGDIVFLSAGDMIPADIKLVTSKDLFVSQSALTGEAMPVEKFAVGDFSRVKSVLELPNVCLMGGNVVSGTATAVALKTGRETYFGSLAGQLVGARVLTAFDKGVNRFTWLMLRFLAVMVPLVFVINGLTKGSWIDAFMFALAVAVGLTPEMLPMIVTVNLAKGALAMSRKKVIVKRLNSIQNFGAMDILFTDKTGTLTQDKVILEKYVGLDGEQNQRVLKYAYLNSYYQTGLKSLLDKAILKRVDMAAQLNPQANYRKIDEVPFDFGRKRMSVIIEEKAQRDVLICKGALEEMLGVCTQADFGEGQVVPITEILRHQALNIARELNEDGLRVIAVAYRELPTAHPDYGVKDEADLVLLGFVAFLDPPKETASDAISALNHYGVRVKILTGDSEIVSQRVCREVGIDVDRAVLGHELDELNDREVADLLKTKNLFAKLSPVHKERIVRAAHLDGHVVGFLGDGINDAAALRAADVGISVDNAVDIAKESADIILLEKSLLVLEQGVIEGRRIFSNIVKYIRMGASSNFGNVFSVVGASALFPFLPMLPVQLLVQNLLYDFSQTAIPFDCVDEEDLEKPRQWDIGNIGRFMLCFGPISSLFDYTTFALMWFVFGANTVERQSLFQSGWFVEGLLSQTLIVHMIRTWKVPFVQSRASLPLCLTTGLIMATGIWLPHSPLAGSLSFSPLPAAYFPWLAVTLVGYAMLIQMVKRWFVHRFALS